VRTENFINFTVISSLTLLLMDALRMLRIDLS